MWIWCLIYCYCCSEPKDVSDRNDVYSGDGGGVKSIGLSQICGCVNIIFYFKIGKIIRCIDHSKIVQVVIVYF